MENLYDMVPIPSKLEMNRGLNAAKESTMMQVFGKPGSLTKKCSDPDAMFLRNLRYGVDVGPFIVSGLEYAVASLGQIFNQVKLDHADVYNEVNNNGMLCIRARKSDLSKFSNHSWGAAIDIYFGRSGVEQGIHKTQYGVYLLSTYFNNNGWYWGAEFSGDYVDSMHFELAEETVLKIGEAQ
jgi:hypothetical protein